MGDARARRKAQNARANRPPPMTTRLAFKVPAQPTDTTCGPTCLHAVYRYHGGDVALETNIDQMRELGDGREPRMSHITRALPREDLTRGVSILTGLSPDWLHRKPYEWRTTSSTICTASRCVRVSASCAAPSPSELVLMLAR